MLCRAVSKTSSGLVVEEIDGLPSVVMVKTIRVNNGTVTDLGGGVVRILLPTDIDGGSFSEIYTFTNNFDGGTFV